MLIDGMDMHDMRNEREDPIFFEVLTGVARKSPSGFRFNRFAEDIGSIQSYLYDIRICCIALTVLIYCILIAYLINKCILRRKRAGNNTRRQWDFQAENNNPTLDCRNQSTQLDDLVSVRSDGQTGTITNNNTHSNNVIGQNAYINRNHRSSTPSMRHGRHQFSLGHEVSNGSKLSEKARLMSSDADTLKHQIPHIITSDLPQSYSNQPNGSTNEESGPNNGSIIQSTPIRPVIHRSSINSQL